MFKSNTSSGGDKTLNRNTINYWKHLVREYELIKSGQHTKYRFVQEFYKAHNLTRQRFNKYYNRFKYSNNELSLLPAKRGAKYHHKRTPGFIEEKIILLRGDGLNRYDIYARLQKSLKGFTPSPSTIYNILRRNGINRLRPKMIRNRRRIIKMRLGELGHIDCHYLPKGIIEGDDKQYYFVGLIDDYSRIAWCEVVEDIRSLTVMFATMRMISMLGSEYGIKFEEIMSDNGPEFGGGKEKNNTNINPFKRLMAEMEIKQRFTKPYRPQTNGKIERFWKTINYDLLEDMVFDSYKHLQDELMQYMVYYNIERPHQALDGKVPADMAKNNSILSSN